jgi:uncharacterized membrane protein
MITTERPTSLRDPFLWVAMLSVGTVLMLLSLTRYWGYNAGMLDLGVMTQAIVSVLRGEPLVGTGMGGNFSRLAGHFELIYLVFAPLVAIWPSPQPLLIGQALLATAGAIPAYRLALRRLDSRLAARCAALIYLLYPVMQTAVLFDFHGDTLAMPLLLFALDAADRKAWRWYALWIALALTCKVYVAAPVAGIGAYLWLWGGQRRAGTWTMIVAVTYGAVVFFGLRQLFVVTPTVTAQILATNYINFYFGAPQQIWLTLPERLGNMLVVFGPALFLAWRGWRWLLPAAPLTLAVLVSTGPGGVYYYAYHHYAMVVPFVVMAIIDGAARLRAGAAQAPTGSVVRRWQPDLVFTTMIVVLCCALLVDQPLNPLFWLAPPGRGLDSAVYGVIARDGLKDRLLAEHAPPRAPIAASMFLAPRLVDRDLLYLVRYPDDSGGRRLPSLLPQVDYVLADALFDWRRVIDGAVVGGPAYEQVEIGIALRDPAFGLVLARDGLLLFQRGAPPEAVLAQQAEVVPTVALPPQPASFGPIRLLGAEVTHMDGRRYRASFAWTADEALPANRALIAVSSLAGVEGARMVHLPSFALLPTPERQAGVIVEERFEVELPAGLPPGRYEWRVSWHDPAHPAAYTTDQRSMIGAAPVAIAEIEVRP